jgi:hypothetical protein
VFLDALVVQAPGHHIDHRHRVDGHAVREDSTTLADHSHRLTASELELRRRGETLLTNQTAITQMSATVSAVKEWMDTMNGSIVRILYIVTVALIILAVVTKLGDLGIL